MVLTPTEQDRLLVFTQAELARRTLARGIQLNAPEATGLICDEMHMAGRAGDSYDEVLAAGLTALKPEQLLDGVADLVAEIRVEVLLDEGTRFFVVRGAGQ